MANPDAFGGGGDLERFKAILAGWRTSLVDLSGRNRLLNFRHTNAATLEIERPSVEELIEGLERGWEFAPLPDEEQDAEESERPQAKVRSAGRYGGAGHGILTQKKTSPALVRALNSLRSKRGQRGPTSTASSPRTVSTASSSRTWKPSRATSAT